MRAKRAWVLASALAAAIFVLACSGGQLQPREPATPLPALPAQMPAALPPSEPAAPATPLPAPPAEPAPGAQGRAPPEPARPTATRPAAPTPASTPTPVLFPLTIVDSNGNEVVFEKPPERIVAYDSAVVEMLFAMDQGHRVVGTHDFLSYPPEAADVPRLGGAFNMNIEAVVAQEPDLVFIFFDRFLPDLERAGLKVLYLKTLNFDFIKVADSIRTWGRITGDPAAAERVATEFEARVAAVKDTMASFDGGLSVFQDVGGFWTPGPDTLVGEVFDLLRLQNIAHDVSGYAQLSPEVIVERDPQLILTADGTSILENPAFKDVSAVKNGQVLELGSNPLSIAGPRFVDGIEELARLVYPALFN